VTGTTESIGRRLRIGEELRSIVGTMKGLAAVSINDYERAVGALRKYTHTIDLGLQILFMNHPDLIPRDRDPPGGRPAVIVVGTDQGLCGPLNRDVVRFARDWAAEHAETRPFVAAIGARAVRELRSTEWGPDHVFGLPGSVEALSSTVRAVVLDIDRWRAEEGVGPVAVVHAEPERRTVHHPVARIVTPPPTERLQAIARRSWPTRQLPAAAPEGRELLADLTRQDLFIGLIRALAEARAAEHGARLAAMQAAERNIEERLDRLRSRYHRVRQAEITAELLDVISGFEALRSPV
jgi:F-type H+-transporting ATPase subunit gamma